MASKVQRQIPCLDLTKNPQDLVKGSDGWKALRSKVREAAEGYGCFQVLYDKLPTELSGKMFEASKELFDLPEEIKKRCNSPKLFFGYSKANSANGNFQAMVIEDALSLQAAQDFTNLMWPNGNPEFCETVNSVSNKMADLGLTVFKMILESYGAEKYYDSFLNHNETILRLLKYENTEDGVSKPGLASHKDGTVFTVVSQNSVQGIEVLLKGEDDYIPVYAQKGGFIFFIGSSLQAWSNGRLQAMSHRVSVSGDKTRYSVLFLFRPTDEAVIKIPTELIDDMHPQLYRPYKFKDFFNYVYCSGLIQLGDPLESFARI